MIMTRTRTASWAKIIAPIAASALWIGGCSGHGEADVELVWVEQDSGVTSSLRGLTVVSETTAWIGAPDGTVLRTIDSGASWGELHISGAEGLDLRSSHGFNDQDALFFTAGTPAQLYRTRDGGESFQLAYEDASPDAFFDTLAFWNNAYGIAFSDPVDGEFHILLTEDGGENWVPAANLPAPLEGEAGFAASNTMITTAPGGRAWIGTGGGETARILYTPDFGSSWEVFDTPIASGSSGAGVFSLTIDDDQLVIVGGSYTDEDSTDGVAAWSKDHGATWRLPASTASGYRSAVAALPGHAGHFVAVGPNGADLSRDGGLNWERVSETGYHAIAFSNEGNVGWAVGSDGRIARVTY
jgi:photosystem II stability/assembly factor-like uncharacterized protein